MHHKKDHGFTLIELMIAVVVLGILAVISFTMYTGKVREGRRSDGLNTLSAMSLAQERYRTNHTTYGTLAEVWNNVATSEAGYYTLDISSITATGYTITATAVGDQANDVRNGVACSPLILTVSQGSVTKAPSACWSQ